MKNNDFRDYFYFLKKMTIPSCGEDYFIFYRKNLLMLLGFIVFIGVITDIIQTFQGGDFLNLSNSNQVVTQLLFRGVCIIISLAILFLMAFSAAILSGNDDHFFFSKKNYIKIQSSSKIRTFIILRVSTKVVPILLIGVPLFVSTLSYDGSQFKGYILWFNLLVFVLLSIFWLIASSKLIKISHTPQRKVKSDYWTSLVGSFSRVAIYYFSLLLASFHVFSSLTNVIFIPFVFTLFLEACIIPVSLNQRRYVIPLMFLVLLTFDLCSGGMMKMYNHYLSLSNIYGKPAVLSLHNSGAKLAENRGLYVWHVKNSYFVYSNHVAKSEGNYYITRLRANRPVARIVIATNQVSSVYYISAYKGALNNNEIKNKIRSLIEQYGLKNLAVIKSRNNLISAISVSGTYFHFGRINLFARYKLDHLMMTALATKIESLMYKKGKTHIDEKYNLHVRQFLKYPDSKSLKPIISNLLSSKVKPEKLSILIKTLNQNFNNALSLYDYFNVSYQNDIIGFRRAYIKSLHEVVYYQISHAKNCTLAFIKIIPSNTSLLLVTKGKTKLFQPTSFFMNRVYHLTLNTIRG